MLRAGSACIRAVGWFVGVFRADGAAQVVARVAWITSATGAQVHPVVKEGGVGIALNARLVADDKLGFPGAAGLACAVYQFIAGHAEAVCD